MWTLKPEVRRLGHTIRVVCPLEIEVDSFPGPLGHVISNLVMNSFVHGFPNGPGGHVEIQVEREGDFARIVVGDDGVGIPEESKARVFEPFFTTRLGRGGSGLGLHICLGIATHVLGGTLTLRPSSGGASFELRIALKAPEGDDGERASFFEI